jgi:hypothetical protein
MFYEIIYLSRESVSGMRTSMRSKIIQQLNKERQAAFLKLDPVKRVLTMERALHDILAAKAEEEGVTDGDPRPTFVSYLFSPPDSDTLPLI